MIQTTCPNCRTVHEVPDSRLGQVEACSACSSSFTVAADTAAAASPAATPPPDEKPAAAPSAPVVAPVVRLPQRTNMPPFISAFVVGMICVIGAFCLLISGSIASEERGASAALWSILVANVILLVAAAAGLDCLRTIARWSFDQALSLRRLEDILNRK